MASDGGCTIKAINTCQNFLDVFQASFGFYHHIAHDNFASFGDGSA